MELLELFVYFCLTSLLTYSVYRIRHFTSMLAQNKIFANEKLMLVHLLSFTVITITATIFGSILLSGVLEEQYTGHSDTMDDR